jgi:hypothetical protein
VQQATADRAVVRKKILRKDYRTDAVQIHVAVADYNLHRAFNGSLKSAGRKKGKEQILSTVPKIPSEIKVFPYF